MSQSNSTEIERADINTVVSDDLNDIIINAIKKNKKYKKDPITKQFFPFLLTIQNGPLGKVFVSDLIAVNDLTFI